MKGSVTMPESLIRRQAPLLLDPGVYYIERAGWGKAAFPKIPEKTIILTYTDGRDERDDFGEEDRMSTTPPKKEKGKNSNAILPSQLPEACITRDDKGNITSIDISKLLIQPDGSPINPAISVKKKAARKKPTFHRKSYIKERTTTNDDKVEIAKEYDGNIESGKIEEVRVPKPERNDLTTDEVDK
jgi:hypothetical protein